LKSGSVVSEAGGSCAIVVVAWSASTINAYRISAFAMRFVVANVCMSRIHESGTSTRSCSAQHVASVGVAPVQ